MYQGYSPWQILVSAHYLENKFIESHQILSMHSYWQDLAWDCYTSFFAHLYQNYGPWFMSKFPFRSISFEQMTDFHQILFTHSYWQDLAWDYYTSFFTHSYQSYGPWITPKFCFPSISREQIDWFSPNFIYAFILTRSSLGLLHVIFHTFVPELWPLVYAKISFQLNILRTNWLIFTKLYMCNHIDKIYRVIVTLHFLLICTRVMALDLLQTSYPLNILRTNGQFLPNFI